MNNIELPPLDISLLLKKYGLRPKKELGQNFLQDECVLKNITDAAQLTKDDIVLEIGPGLGSLTRHLALASREVVAVELDRKLIPIISQILISHQNVKLIHGNILELNIADLFHQPQYIVVANIPYNITSFIIRHLMESQPPPSRMILTVQKEVAARICALPGKFSLLAISVQVYGKPETIAQIPATAFYPSPNVESAVVRVNTYPAPVIATDQLSSFFYLARAGFKQKRKTLRNALSPILGRMGAEDLLNRSGIDYMRRAETISLEEWGLITKTYLESDYNLNTHEMG